MPYISDHIRRSLLQPVFDESAETAGELNYQITMLLKDYLQEHRLSYATCNDILGALDGARSEFYRRIVAPYEDRKIKENGDVWDGVRLD